MPAPAKYIVARCGGILPKPSITLLPIGSTESSEAKTDLQKVSKLLGRLDVEFACLDPLPDAEQALAVGRQLRCRETDLFVLLVLHGLTADIQVNIVSQLQVPAVIWALPHRHSLSTSASAIGAIRDLGRPIDLLYGPADDELVAERVSFVSKCAHALNQMRATRIGEIGGLYPILVASKYHENTLTQKLGPRIIHITLNELRSHFDAIDFKKVEEAATALSEEFRVLADKATYLAAVKFHLALREIANKHKLSGIALNCYGELIKEFKSTPCLGFVDKGYVVGCEGDVVALSMLLLSRYLTGMDGFLADPYTVEKDGTLVMVNCAGSASLSNNSKDTTIVTGGSTVDMPVPLAFCRPMLPNTEVTLARIFGRNLDKIHVAVGQLVSCETREGVTLSIRMKEDIKTFLGKICNAHYIIYPRDISRHLKLLCTWMGIEDV